MMITATVVAHQDPDVQIIILILRHNFDKHPHLLNQVFNKQPHLQNESSFSCVFRVPRTTVLIQIRLFFMCAKSLKFNAF